jgi:hypothetical protein
VCAWFCAEADGCCCCWCGYAGRKEFIGYLPEGTQGVIVQPLGNAGVLVVGTDTLRGLSRLDQVCCERVLCACCAVDGAAYTRGCR